MTADITSRLSVASSVSPLRRTATTRTGLARWTFPPGEAPAVVIDAAASVNGALASSVSILLEEREVRGSVTTRVGCSDLTYTAYFVAAFDAPFAGYGTWEDGIARPDTTQSGSMAGAYVVFDLPEVVPLAERRLRQESLLERATIAAGDFYSDELPVGCDLALLSAIIHQNSPEQNLELYRKVHRALAPNGVLLIRDHIMNEGRTEPADGALFALNMLVCTDGGDTYTFAETEEALLQAGFRSVKRLRYGEAMDSLVEAAV